MVRYSKLEEDDVEEGHHLAPSSTELEMEEDGYRDDEEEEEEISTTKSDTDTETEESAEGDDDDYYEGDVEECHTDNHNNKDRKDRKKTLLLEFMTSLESSECSYNKDNYDKAAATTKTVSKLTEKALAARNKERRIVKQKRRARLDIVRKVITVAMCIAMMCLLTAIVMYHHLIFSSSAPAQGCGKGNPTSMMNGTDAAMDMMTPSNNATVVIPEQQPKSMSKTGKTAAAAAKKKATSKVLATTSTLSN